MILGAVEMIAKTIEIFCQFLLKFSFIENYWILGSGQNCVVHPWNIDSENVNRSSPLNDTEFWE